MSEIVEVLSWVMLILRSDKNQRRRIVDAVLRGVRSFNSKKGQPTKEGNDLVKWLKKMDLVGITPNIMYLKTDGKREQLDSLYVHPWGTAKLLYKHKKLPVLVIVGSDLRFNESVLHEVHVNKYNDWVRGLTG